MAIIYSYPNPSELHASDMLIGSAQIVENNVARQVTKNFTLGQLQDFIGSGLTLSTIGNNGPATLVNNVLNIPIYNNGNTYDFIAPLYNVDQVVYMVSATGSNDGYLKYTDWNTFNNKQGAITLTTTGTSGVATFTGNTLNIPNYSAAAVTPTLDEVLNEGNTSEVNAYVGGELGLYDVANTAYSTLNAFDNAFTFNDSNGEPVLYFEQGVLAISKSTTIAGTIGVSLLSVSRNYSLPDASGTIALTSDIPSLAGYVQTSRTLTINGTTYDLSANRTWSVGTVTDVIGSGLITSTGGANPVISTQINTNVLVGRTTAGTGAMEEITIGSGLTLSSGTLSATSTGGGIPHTTAAGTDTYTATVASVTSYADGDAYLVRFTNGNTTGATLNINGLGAIPLYRNNDGAVIGGDIWDGAEMLCVYNSTTTAFQCIGTSSNSLFAYVTNADSVDITKGQPVYAFGGTGDRLTVKRALNTSDATSAQTVGVVLTSSIAVNQKGIIIIQGLLDGLSILPTSTWADGDPVYLGTTAGSITNVKQYAPNHLVYLGTVTTASNGSAGRWYVRVQNGYELDELHNVQAQSPSLNDTLYYDSGVTPGQWKTASIPTILGYTPFNLPSLTSGSVIFSNGTTLAQDNANFFWDDTNNRLGVGTTTPNERLHVQGNIQIGQGTGVLEKIWCSGGNLISYDPIPGNISIGNSRIVTNAVTQTTTIADSLFVNGNIRLGAGVGGAETLTSASGGSMISFNGTNAFNIANGTISSNIISQVVSTNFFLGVGTTAPSARLHVNGSMYLQNSATGVESITFSNGPQIEANGPLGYFRSGQVYTNTFVNFVGIGTSSPTTELEVAGVITATGGNSTSWNAKQDPITLTTTGTSGPATLVGSTLNIPQYSGGGGSGLQGISNLLGYFPGGLGISAAIVGHNTTTLATVANNLLLNPFIPNKTITSSSLNINVTVAGAGVIARILVYSNLNGLPNTKLYESSDLSLATTGIKTATVSFTFTAGTTYWLALNTSGAATINCMPNTAVTPIFNSGTAPVTMHRNPAVPVGSAPATYTYSSFQTTAVPLIWINT